MTAEEFSESQVCICVAVEYTKELSHRSRGVEEKQDDGNGKKNEREQQHRIL